MHFVDADVSLFLLMRTQDGDDLLLGGKGNGARNLGARALGGFHNALGAAINQVVLIRLELDADFLVGHLFSSYFYRSRGQRGEHPFHPRLRAVGGREWGIPLTFFPEPHGRRREV